MYSIGIDIGYSSVKAVLSNEENKIVYNTYLLHKGRIKEALVNIVDDLQANFNTRDIRLGAVTGSGSKYITDTGEMDAVNEVAAIVEGSMATNKKIGSIIEIGGQNAKFITGFNGSDKSHLKISMNSNCSAGTGSFLEEQMSRLNLKLEDYSIYTEQAHSIPRIAGRCSVFAKTDITHHQQEGVGVADILLGLAYAVIRNYKGAVIKKLPVVKPVLFVGGVAHNQGIVTALKDVLNLTAGDLIIPDCFYNIGAVGAATLASQSGLRIDFGKFAAKILELHIGYSDQDQVKLPVLKTFGTNDSIDKHICQGSSTDQEMLNCYLGVDIGSTSTNIVLMNEEKEIIAFKYLKTLGNPIMAVKKGFQELAAEYGSVNIIGAGATGSGRYMIGQLIGVDVIKDEITAQAKAATTIDKDVDTVFEIGGQDSKYIGLQNSVVTDFQMNKICAAGTGSFIEEQAKKFNIPIDEFGAIALSSNRPINLGERCTVFIETSIAANLSKGAKLEDISAGLCYSIVRNYLDRVVGQKRIGNKIFFQGGVAYNQGIINAFRAVTGKEIIVPPFFSITGAYGAAILAQEESVTTTAFKGFILEDRQEFLKRHQQSRAKQDTRPIFDEKVHSLIFDNYEATNNPNQPTVGIPRALFTYGMFSMFNALFRELGCNVVLSDPTSEKTIELGQEYALDETCYPVKLITGHVAELVKKKVDYIFFPDLFTVDHPGSMSRQNYGCAYMQLAFKVMNQSMELEQQGIQLLAPSMAFSLGKEYMMESFAKLGQQLGKSREQTARALQKGMEAFYRFEDRIEENSKKVLQELKPNERAFVIISKLYGVADPVLNLGIPDKLRDMGYKTIAFYDLPEGDISLEHPNMFWPFGQHILEPAQLVKQHPNLYAILLTHHGCGPDSVLSHYIREIMDGKQYLHIEVDEHSSGVGVLTRVEAFINSLKSVAIQEAQEMEVYVNQIPHQKVDIKTSITEIKDKAVVYLPYLPPYSEIFAEILIQKGITAQVLPETSRDSVEVGRRFTITEEYFSFTALAGDIFQKLLTVDRQNLAEVALLIPQNEGTETDGQYSRLLRTKLDEEGLTDIAIASPFIEDVLSKDKRDIEMICLGLLAGDLVRIAPWQNRVRNLEKVLDMIRTNCFSMEGLIEIAKAIYQEIKKSQYNKKILAVGEALTLYNDFLNNYTFSNLEEKGHRLVYSPLSETIWMLWQDFFTQNSTKQTLAGRKRLAEFKNNIKAVSRCLLEESPFERNLTDLISRADRTVGYYSGGNGRYRAAKALSDLPEVDGIITVASMYENTGIVLGILHKGFAKPNSKPVLNLTFDGNITDNDKTKIESFVYYL